MLGQAVRLMEKGALDGLAKDEVDRLAPRAEDYVLVTRLMDGTSVKVARRLIVPKIQRCIEELEGLEVDLNVLLCTGELPRFKSQETVDNAGSPNHKPCTVR
ncbi:MAG: AroM family protein [Candidatus Bathyarchaeia archaeon]